MTPSKTTEPFVWDSDYLAEIAADYGFVLTAPQLMQFAAYATFLVAYNQRVNLTAIVAPREIAVKHFLDSLLLLDAVSLPHGATLIDVGTGAGFPSVPCRIVRNDLAVTLLDSLNKRLTFLAQLSERLGQPNLTLHARAEDAGHQPDLREQFDVATARAVAPLRELLEYCLPFVKVGGAFVALKGGAVADEGSDAVTACERLGGQLEAQQQVVLPDPERSRRTLLAYRKVAPTPDAFPRGRGKIQKSPL